MLAFSRRINECVADLTHAIVGNAYHGDLPDGGVLVDHVLDLGRVRVEAADDEHVLGAVRDADVAAVVHDRDIAGVQPPVGVDDLRGRFRIVDEAPHDVVAPDHHLARFAARNLCRLLR